MSSVSNAREGAVQKLPLWDTICLSYSSFFGNFRDVLLICWLWLIVVAPLMAITSAMQWSWIARTMAELKERASLQRPPLSTSMPLELRVLIYGVGLLFMAAGVSVAVAWHRRIILGEQPRLSGSNVGTGSFWRYVGIGIAVALTAFAPMVLGALILFVLLSPFVAHGAPGIVHAGIVAVTALIMVALYLTFITVILRLCLLLPARAVGDLSVTFRQAWNSTRGNTWRLFWGILACTLPPMLIIQIASLIFLGFPKPGSFAGGELSVPVLVIIWAVFYLLIIPIWAGFLSLSYLHFFRTTSGLQSPMTE